MIVKLLIMIAWFIASILSVNALDRSLRVYILDYEVKRPRILRTIIVMMIWVAVTLGCLVKVLGD